MDIMRLVGKEVAVALTDAPLLKRITLADRLERVSKSMQEMVKEVVWPALVLQAPEVEWDIFRDYRLSRKRDDKLSVMRMWTYFVEKDLDLGRNDVFREFMRVNLGVEEAQDFTYEYLAYRSHISRCELKVDKLFPLRLYVMQQRNRADALCRD